MYYHIQIETKEKVDEGKFEQIFELDKLDTSGFEKNVITPYFKDSRFRFNGYFIEPKNVRRIIIYESEKTTDDLISDFYNRKMPENVIISIQNSDMLTNMVEITEEIFAKVQDKIELSNDNQKGSERTKEMSKTKVFIVHGHDNSAKLEVARFIEKIGLEAIILHEMPSNSKSIIEKIESYSSSVGFGIVIYSGCDVGASKEEFENNNGLKSRARQNVVFEHGFLIGKLKRKNVCALVVKGEIELPNDISGVVYVEMSNDGGWKIDLAKELRSSGYAIDFNKAL